uniref:methylcrotonoyl-CoA carboxylase n=1 Tax=Phallusia mammillata TaxID=59560 RepID=A0A6F9DKW9_9ASCI|nr:probable methylcrotonoyl-CoA carboxylase beta chain, mitochondrial [Phallusia mammillata]
MALQKGLLHVCQTTPRLCCCVANHHSFSKILDGQIPQSFQHIKEINAISSKKQKVKFEASMEQVLKGGGKKGIQRHVVRNKKMLVRDRIKLLLDKDSETLELSALAGLGMEYGDVPCAGAVTLVGKIHGLWCMVVGNDATVKSGSIYPITLKKQLRAQQIAAENRLPTVHLVDSGGAFLPLQSEIFNPGGRIFYNEAVMSAAGISQVAVVCGSCTAGAAYIPAMADEAVILDKIGTIFLGGPPLVQAATGEKVTAEELGGASLHCRQSGCTDHFATSEEMALATARDIIATINLENSTNATSYEEPLHDVTQLNSLAPSHGVGYQLDSRYTLAHIVDGSAFHEFKEHFGTTLVTGFGRVKGHLAGFVANNGRLSGPAALKGSHFVQLCSQRNIPLVYLQHFTDNSTRSAAASDNTETEAEISSLVKSHAQLMQAVACCGVPSISLATGGIIGTLESHSLGSLSMGSRFQFIYPNVRVGGHDPVYLAKNLSKAQLPDAPEDQVNQRMLDNYEKHSAETESFFAASRMFNDGIILPEQTRDVIAKCLSVFQQERTAYARYKPSVDGQQTNFRM